MKRSIGVLSLALVLALVSVACSSGDGGGSGTGGGSGGGGGGSSVDLSAPCPGPQGQPGSAPSDLQLSDDEIQRVRSGDYTAAVTWAGSGPWYEAVDRGFNDMLDTLNIKRVASASAEYDTAKQAADVENAMALDPDIVLGSPVDAVAAAEAYQPVVDAGKVLVLSDNVPDGYVAGKDYVGFVSGNRCDGGKMMADLMSQAIGGEGDIGMIYYDADYYVTNILDEFFKASIEQKYPNIHIVAESGFAQETATQDIAAAMIAQNPDIKGIYVTWSIAGQGVLAALRDAGRTDIKVITHDLDPTNDVDLASGGNLYATVVEDLYQLGQSLATEAAYGLLGKEAPAFVAVPYIQATKDTIVDAYQEALRVPAPAEVVKAAQGG